MTIPPAEPTTHEHPRLRGAVGELLAAARDIPHLAPVERAARRDGAVAFLEGDLLPHARAEERGLYREVGRILGHPEATAPMVYDHLAVREWTAALADADPADADRLQELLYGLHALIVEHFRKEEELYEPLLERLESGPGMPDYDAPVLRREP